MYRELCESARTAVSAVLADITGEATFTIHHFGAKPDRVYAGHELIGAIDAGCLDSFSLATVSDFTLN